MIGGRRVGRHLVGSVLVAGLVAAVLATPTAADAAACASAGGTGSSAAVSTNSSDTKVFIVGTNRAVYYRSLDAPGAAFVSLGLSADHHPSAVSWDGRRVDVFVTGSDRRLHHRAQVGGTWSPWEDLGGVLTSAPAAVSFVSGQLVVLARGGQGQLVSRRYAGGGRWLPWVHLGGSFVGAPGAVVDPDTRTGRIALRRADGALLEATLKSDGTRGTIVAQGYPVCSAPTLAARSSDGTAFTRARVEAGGSAVLDEKGVTSAYGGSIVGSVGVLTVSGRGFVLAGRGPGNRLWVYDARDGNGAWMSLGGAVR